MAVRLPPSSPRAPSASASASALFASLMVLSALNVRGQEEGVRFVDSPTSDDLHWEDIASWRDLPGGAVWCGYQYPNDETARRERAYVARLYRGGALIPGKATFWGASAAVANSTYGSSPTFEVAVVSPHRVQWVAAANGFIPLGAPACGITRDSQPLYSCKFHYDRHLSMACGAVQRYSERCVAEMDGNLVSSAVYEVLTLLPPSHYPLAPPPPPPPPPAYPALAAAPRYIADDPDQTPPRPPGRQ